MVAYHTTLNCFQNKARFQIPSHPNFNFKGGRSRVSRSDFSYKCLKAFKKRISRNLSNSDGYSTKRVGSDASDKSVP